jgi:hypothetical protein
MNTITGGYYNTSVGYYSLQASPGGDSNTAIGTFSLQLNNSASYNTAVGFFSLAANTSGYENVAIGTYAGATSSYNNFNSVQDSRMVFLGVHSSRDGNIVASTTGLTNSIAIGYNSKVGGSNMMALGGLGPNAVNVGIATSTPTFALVVGSGSTTEAAKSIQVPYGGICVDNDGWCNASTTGRVSAVSFLTSSSDLAENYQAFENNLEAGDIVAITNTNLTNNNIGPSETYGLMKAKSGTSIIGVISTKPGITLGLDNDNVNTTNQKPVALSGRVPVKVNLEGGPILPGDQITISSLSGIGTKATSSGEMIGYALEAFGPSSPQAGGVGKILVFVNLGYGRLSPQVAGGEIGNNHLWDLTETGQIKALGDLDMGGFSLSNIKTIVGLNNNWSIDENGLLKAKSIEISDSLKIGSPDKRIGFTLYDEQTGEPYCIAIAGGLIKNTKGECGLVTNPVTSSGGGYGQVAGTSTDQAEPNPPEELIPPTSSSPDPTPPETGYGTP